MGWDDSNNWGETGQSWGEAKDDGWASQDWNSKQGDSGQATASDPWSQADAPQESAPAADPWSQAAAPQESQAAAAADPWAAASGQDPWASSNSAEKQESGASWHNMASSDSWNTAAPASAPPSGKAYWDAQEEYKSYGTLPGKPVWEQDQDDQNLFKERLGNQGLDFSRYDSVPVEVSGDKSDAIPALDSFEAMYASFKDAIPEALVANVRRCNYDKPTPVQKYAIPVGLCGRDVMCCAQTGSGKTAAFLFPVIGRMMLGLSNPVGGLTEPFAGVCQPDTLILTPTRELCIQEQMRDLAKGTDVLVATPGRLSDFIGRGILGVENVVVLVLDEADRMLDMGFEKQIREITEEHRMPKNDSRQTMMFSATFPDACQKMAQDFLYNYIWIGVGIIGGAVDTVQQELRKVTPKQKFEVLFEVLDDFYDKRKDKERVLVFVNAKDTARWLDEQLHEKNYDTGALHGDLQQNERETNLKRFRAGDIDVMIATDVAARGLDIEHVGLVVNYDMPQQTDTYIHRIGRTGRIGHEGRAITFIACDEYGTCVEQVEVLKSLQGIMQAAKSTVPDWLDPLVEAASQGSWASGNNWKDSWGGRDARPQWSKEKDGGSSSWGDDKKSNGNDNSSWDNWSKGADKSNQSWS
eukprot:TRINITY_DN11523_c0_g1_i2.p1 TRINITY_DN11523_c0_g1~~TRINITY_DN11523_c0_g1_i2.p1  ORF type:complete len:639 (+),score=141.79 TRINITY_DN11523_c0_g1_i2:42-1958(+)